VRKAEFRSPEHEKRYFAKCDAAIKKWKQEGPKPLNEEMRDQTGNIIKKGKTTYNSGVWLFTDRENITHFFPPNFLPPYDTPEKRKIINEFLSEEWNEKTLMWKPAGTVGDFDDKLDDVLKKVGLGSLDDVLKKVGLGSLAVSKP
jgi:hypothetical protein